MQQNISLMFFIVSFFPHEGRCRTESSSTVTSIKLIAGRYYTMKQLMKTALS